MNVLSYKLDSFDNNYSELTFTVRLETDLLPVDFFSREYTVEFMPISNSPAEKALENSISLLLVHVRAKINTSITCEENILGNSRVNPFVIKKLESEGFLVTKLDDSRFVVKW